MKAHGGRELRVYVRGAAGSLCTSESKGGDGGDFVPWKRRRRSSSSRRGLYLQSKTHNEHAN